ncbi:tRNA-dihydrouridine(47) synthase [NAD(P)(+)] [Grifola frondosa]|uniref:tRNA-dihydrouridine(47) synthase [NAD(P)(+)] n=1 Tax=Grifola frondosa TaxID=5627 RepID=A0A1C7LQ30_GRIFR|nr:tRNA-dihydrouridine(47) synthase [NAD(P)(+)] [Grifola frondosa]
MSVSLPPGTAPIKPQFLLSYQTDDVPDDDAAEGSTSHADGRRDVDPRDQETEGGGKKISGAQRRKIAKEERKNKRGANKGRRFQKVRDEVELCWRIASGNTCDFGSEYVVLVFASGIWYSLPCERRCRFTHDIAAYLAAKPKDIHFPSPADLIDCPPFVKSSSEDEEMTVREYQENGLLNLVVDEEKKARVVAAETEVNFIGPNTLRKIRTKKFPCPIADAYLKELQTIPDDDKKETQVQSITLENETAPNPTQAHTEGVKDATKFEVSEDKSKNISQVDSPDVPMRSVEKKRLHWAGKTYLAPLTTVGNLPFRRLCVDYGADITCGEMGLAMSFLQGSKEEWSLVRRHPSESIFGVQIAGSKPSLLVPAAEIIGRECAGNLDFVDINCGCPIDLVYKTGSGSALLDAAGKLGKIIVGMNKALGDIPVTVKLRTGVKDGRNTAHKLMPRLGPEWNTAALTLHGRTRQQRYTKLADWDYVKQCVEAVRAREAEEDLPPVPIFGGGDCFSSEDYWSKMEDYGVDGVMIGRGALIKPWIFTEVKERREWDISSRERLELVRKVCSKLNECSHMMLTAEYLLVCGVRFEVHFGSDTAGVNTTRRYLCEALSFQYRYIPIGLLECLPGRLNDRAPSFRGRDELETLLASGDSRDWVRISEMFLGPAPETWTFTPKHKSNAYGNEESQG